MVCRALERETRAWEAQATEEQLRFARHRRPAFDVVEAASRLASLELS
jgi:hypothetical protein